jgi:hypothetical protein
MTCDDDMTFLLLRLRCHRGSSTCAIAAPALAATTTATANALFAEPGFGVRPFKLHVSADDDEKAQHKKARNDGGFGHLNSLVRRLCHWVLGLLGETARLVHCIQVED